MAALRRVALVSLVCGLAWSAIVIALHFSTLWWISRSTSDAIAMISTLVAGVWLSPVIGLLAGLSSRFFPAQKRVRGAVFALVSLYATAALYGLGSQCFRILATGATRPLWEGPYLTLYGLTLYGYFVILWPLAYVNHWFVSRLWHHETFRDALTA